MSKAGDWDTVLRSVCGIHCWIWKPLWLNLPMTWHSHLCGAFLCLQCVFDPQSLCFSGHNYILLQCRQMLGFKLYQLNDYNED